MEIERCNEGRRREPCPLGSQSDNFADREHPPTYSVRASGIYRKVT